MNKSLLHLAAIVAIDFLCCDLSAGQAIGEGTREIHFDTRYVEPEYSNRGLTQFGLDLMDAASLPASILLPVDSIGTDDEGRFAFYTRTQWKNLGRGLLTLVSSAFVGSGFTFTFHEFGHGTRVAAAGFKPFYGHGSINSTDDIERARRSGALKDNFFSFWLSSITNTGGFTLATDDETLFPPLTPDLQSEYGLVGLIAAGGLNNEMLFSEVVADRIRRRGGHIGYFPVYVTGKTAVLSYSYDETVFNDKFNTVSYYRSIGLDVDKDDVDRGSLRALFLSATTYQLGLQFFRMFAGRSTDFEAYAPYGIDLPDVSFYMTSAGLSHKIRTGYRYQDWRFPLELEVVYSGGDRKELTLGAERHLGPWYGSLSATIGRAVEPTLTAQYRAHRNLLLSGGYSYYNRRNLQGERTIPSLESESGFHEVWVGLAAVY